MNAVKRARISAPATNLKQFSSYSGCSLVTIWNEASGSQIVMICLLNKSYYVAAVPDIMDCKTEKIGFASRHN